MSETAARDTKNTKPATDYRQIQSIPEIWAIASQRYGQIVALRDPHAQPAVEITHAQLYQQIRTFAAGLQAKGFRPQTNVALIADNSPRWFVADQGIMTAGGVDSVRSAQADREELLYIIADSNSTVLVLENAQLLDKLRDRLADLPIELVVLLSNETPSNEEVLNVVNFSQLMAAGDRRELQPVEQTKQTLATLIYTSGTSGNPKGVLLSHSNLLHQIFALEDVLQPEPGDRLVSILPSWHAYERTAEYFFLSRGATLNYTHLRYFKKDIQEQRPQYVVGVPRLWESIYEGVQKQLREASPTQQRVADFFLDTSRRYIQAKRTLDGLDLENLTPTPAQKLAATAQVAALYPLHRLGDRLVYGKIRQAIGGQLKSFFSGGGSLAKHIDEFFEIIDVTLLVGYGLTETAPVTHARRFDRNLRGSAGRPLPQTEAKIVDPQTRQPLPVGQQGLVLLRGPQVMQGYHQKPEATAKAIDSDGWFNSGDLGWVTPSNDLILTGRAKDTIVLSNGENIEPQPLEDACVRSPYIDQIMVVGQDQRSLGALIVPNLDALRAWAVQQQLGLEFADASDCDNPAVRNLLRRELNLQIQDRPGYRPDDRIGPFVTLSEPFSIENGMLTQTLKLKRPVVYNRYSDAIAAMFAKN